MNIIDGAMVLVALPTATLCINKMFTTDSKRPLLLFAVTAASLSMVIYAESDIAKIARSHSAVIAPTLKSKDCVPS